jgi:hypothetical protein
MINLSKTVKDLYNGNYKTLKKLRKILEDGKTCHVHGLAELNCENGCITENDLWI